MIESFNNTSRYLDDILNVGNHFFPYVFHNIYPPQLRLKANVSDTEAAFLDLHISLEQSPNLTLRRVAMSAKFKAALS